MEPNLLVDLVNMPSKAAGPTSGPRVRKIARELRRDRRVPVRQMILTLPDGARYVAGNVSVGGVGFELDDETSLRPGQEFSVRLSVPDNHEPLDMRARLCHLRFVESAGRYYGGAKFVDVDALNEWPLFRYIEEASLVLMASAVVR